MVAPSTGQSAAGSRRRWFAVGAVAAGIVTAIFAVVGDGAPEGRGSLLLDHGHAAVWALLTAALTSAAILGRWQRAATVLASMALGLYVAFLAALLW